MFLQIIFSFYHSSFYGFLPQLSIVVFVRSLTLCPWSENYCHYFQITATEYVMDDSQSILQEDVVSQTVN